MPHGYGIYVWGLKALNLSQFPVKNQYEGNWADGKRQGFGTYQYATGATYTGEWTDNKKHGQGIYISENGRTFSGTFQKDKIENWEENTSNGKFILIYGQSPRTTLNLIQQISLKWELSLKIKYQE